jgi:hypothetical protein
MSVGKLSRALASAVFLVLVAAPLALAAGGGSAKAGYSGAAGVLTRTRSGGGLPFTGLDLSFLVVGGVVLALLGMGLRRASRTRA